jgi:steroid delta-isomerase-like uncharacterized protein
MPTNTEIVKGAVEALNNHDAAALCGFWAADGVERFPDETCHGTDAIGTYFQRVFDAFPDLRVAPEAFAEDGESVFMRSVISGTHTGGPFGGIVPTGKAIELPAIDHFTIRDGKIVSNFVVFDQMEIGRQLGLLPPDGGAADKAMKGAFNALITARNKVKAAR